MKIIEDLKRISKGSFKKAAVTVITNPCFHSVCLYRLFSFLYRIHFAPLAKLVWYINRIIYCVDIDYRADLAGGFVLVHGLGVVIGRSVVSEGNLTVYQGVTIGGTGRYIEKEGKKIWMPVIGKNVTLATDSKCFGPIYIKENSFVKAGSVITKDIE